MKDEYHFANMKGVRSPYTKLLKQSITIRLDRQTVQYFIELPTDVGMPYENLIKLHLRDCVAKRRRLDPRWVP